jgi:hypothetical protein
VDIGPVQRLAPTVANEHLGDCGAARPLHHFAVRTFERRNIEFARRAQHRMRELAGVVGGLNPDGALGAPAARIGGAAPVFDAPIDVEDRVIVPGRIAGFGREIVPVVAVSARRPSH